MTPVWVSISLIIDSDSIVFLNKSQNDWQQDLDKSARIVELLEPYKKIYTSLYLRAVRNQGYNEFYSAVELNKSISKHRIIANKLRRKQLNLNENISPDFLIVGEIGQTLSSNYHFRGYNYSVDERKELLEIYKGLYEYWKWKMNLVKIWRLELKTVILLIKKIDLVKKVKTRIEYCKFSWKRKMRLTPQQNH